MHAEVTAVSQRGPNGYIRCQESAISQHSTVRYSLRVARNDPGGNATANQTLLSHSGCTPSAHINMPPRYIDNILNTTSSVATAVTANMTQRNHEFVPHLTSSP
jgi:hypothetical protein